MGRKKRNPKITPAMVTMAVAKHHETVQRLKKHDDTGIKPWPVIEARRQRRAETAMRAALGAAFEVYDQETPHAG